MHCQQPDGEIRKFKFYIFYIIYIFSTGSDGGVPDYRTMNSKESAKTGTTFQGGMEVVPPGLTVACMTSR
jgi:hypothetical protein